MSFCSGMRTWQNECFKEGVGICEPDTSSINRVMVPTHALRIITCCGKEPRRDRSSNTTPELQSTAIGC